LENSANELVAFYDRLAPLFDVMTDWEARLAAEGPFLRSLLEEVGAVRVLDAACGSGGHALALAGWGYAAAGADISPAMISLAQAKAAAAGQDVSFAVAGLEELPRRLTGPYDAVLCLGNSLPHLLSQTALIAALRGIAAVLRPGGLLVTHNLNYDLRWRTRPRFFAAQGGVLEGQEVLVWRFADYDSPAGRIAFHIALFRKSLAHSGSHEKINWDVQVQTTPQRPLFHADLVEGLVAAGFESIKAYAHLAWPPELFNADTSPDLVVVARKTESA
jgi:glycine/sarcosine N-methyltransferase